MCKNDSSHRKQWVIWVSDIFISLLYSVSGGDKLWRMFMDS